jgi:hypothetical protein
MTPFQNWLQATFALPTKTIVKEAFSSWILKTISFTDMPASGLYGGLNWILNDYGRELCRGALATVASRWQQDVTSIYNITVQSQASIAAHGLLEISREHAVSADRSADFTQFSEYKAPVGQLISAGNWVQKTETSVNNPLLTALHQAKTELLQRHRSNTISFSVPINADLDLIHTVRVNHAKIQAKGKIFTLQHFIDIDAGTAITDVQLAIYLPNIASQTDTIIAAPASPYTDPGGLPSTLAALGTYIGNVANAPVQDPNWVGWVTNYEAWIGPPPAPPYYDVGFTVDYPAITETEPVEFFASASYNVAIPQDEFVIIK